MRHLVTQGHGVVTPPVCDLIKCDLTRVGKKLMEPYPEGKGWTAEQVFEAETWYRRYLLLCKKYPGHPAVPNGPIDTFWHQHILDTMAYGDDCHDYFGYFLHHYPYFGLNGPEDAQNRDNAFVETNELYLAEFGEDCTAMLMFASKANSCTGNGEHQCKSGCSSPEAKDCEAMCAPACNQVQARGCNDGDTRYCKSGCSGRIAKGTGCEANNCIKPMKASGCNPPCSAEACKAGCKQCTVVHGIAKPKTFCRAGKAGPCMTACEGKGPQALATACGGGGSGTGCGQGCSRGR